MENAMVLYETMNIERFSANGLSPYGPSPSEMLSLVPLTSEPKVPGYNENGFPYPFFVFDDDDEDDDSLDEEDNFDDMEDDFDDDFDDDDFDDDDDDDFDDEEDDDYDYEEDVDYDDFDE
jgi:hypothetical protein